MTRTVAIVGASKDRAKFGNKAVRAFVRAGWLVHPVNPNETEVEGIPTFASLADLPGPVDVVSFYVSPHIGITLLHAVAQWRDTELWLNPGSADKELLREAQELGLHTKQLCSILTLGFSPSDFPAS
jgi:predicted CoA-binding protein